MKLLNSLILLLLLSSCAGNNSSPATNDTTQKLMQAPDTALNCSTKEVASEFSKDSTLIQTCVWKGFRFVSIGEPDYRGRYSYEYKLYRSGTNDTIAISNREIFNENVGELEKLINNKISENLVLMRQDKESAECLAHIPAPNFSIDQMGISFDELKRMHFHIELPVAGACFNVSVSIVTFERSEIIKYIR